MRIPARSKVGDLVDRALDLTVAPGYSKIGFEVRERIWARERLELDGKVAIVTGATSGIGEAACVGMARGGAEVHLVVRNLEKGDEARERIAAEAGVEADSLALHRCDLSNLGSVRSFAAAFLRATRGSTCSSTTPACCRPSAPTPTKASSSPSRPTSSARSC